MKKLLFLFLCFCGDKCSAQPIVCGTSQLFNDTSQHLPILMNEILPEGEYGETWVELYNCRSDTTDFSGWFFTNDPMDSLKFRVDSLLIPPAEFTVLGLPFPIPRSFGLLQLWRPDSTMAYGMTFDGVEIGESVGFCGNMIKRMVPSPGVENNCTTTGIEEIPSDALEANYYDLLGREVNKPETGLYVVVQGRVRRKVCIVK